MMKKKNHLFSMLCGVIIILFCSLSVWQFHRYEEKKQLLQTYQKRLHELPKPFEFLSGNIKDLQFQPVAVQGEWMSAFTLLMQNRMHKGKPGFEVITPLQIKGNPHWLLVDRGWVPKKGDKTLPFLPPISGKLPLLGYIKLLNEHPVILGKNILDAESKPWVMQKIDINELSRLTKHDFYPFMLRLDPREPYGFVRDEVISITPPERHFIYAIQWIALAIMVLVGYLCFCMQRVER